jgi:hypothetical protein
LRYFLQKQNAPLPQKLLRRLQVSKARDLATLAGSATVLATDSEVTAAVAAADSTPTALMTMGA